jgi:hypothetical protein
VKNAAERGSGEKNAKKGCSFEDTTSFRLFSNLQALWEFQNSGFRSFHSSLSFLPLSSQFFETE